MKDGNLKRKCYVKSKKYVWKPAWKYRERVYKKLEYDRNWKWKKGELR